MPKVTEEHREARRQQILGAATRCFARKGLHRASIQDVIDESGLSAGAIYSYFKSKEEIIEAIADERHTREREVIEAAARLGELDQVLVLLADAFVGALADRRERLERQVGIELWAEALRNPRLRRIVRRGVDQPRAALAALVREAQQRGEIPGHIDPDALARVLIGIFHGYVLQQAWDPRADAEAYLVAVQALTAAFINGPNAAPVGRIGGPRMVERASPRSQPDR